MDEKQNTEVIGSWSSTNTRIIVTFRVENVNPHLHTNFLEEEDAWWFNRSCYELGQQSLFLKVRCKFSAMWWYLQAFWIIPKRLWIPSGLSNCDTWHYISEQLLIEKKQNSKTLPKTSWRALREVYSEDSDHTESGVTRSSWGLLETPSDFVALPFHLPTISSDVKLIPRYC